MEKPRHIRILERMNEIADMEISKMQLSGEGAITVFKDGNNFNLSGDYTGGRDLDPEPDEEYNNNVPLKVESGGVSINIGLMDGVVVTLDGVSIYGTGTMDSRPLLPKADAEVWVKITVEPSEIWKYSETPDVFRIGDLVVTDAIVVTSAIGVGIPNNNATFEDSTGALTPGEYYKWLGTIFDEEVFFDFVYFTSKTFSPSILSSQNFLSGLNDDPDLYFRYTACQYFPDTAPQFSSEPITFI